MQLSVNMTLKTLTVSVIVATVSIDVDTNGREDTNGSYGRVDTTGSYTAHVRKESRGHVR